MADRLGDRPGPVGPADGERQHGAELIIADAQDVTASGSDATWLFGLFAFLLALSLIVHQLWWGGFGIDARHSLVVLAALAVLRRPTSTARFLAMIAVEVVAVGLDMPDVGSHTLLVLVIGATVLVHVGWTACRDRQLPDAGVLFTRIAPFLGVQLLLLYGLSALAKMNTGFFDVHTSCAAVMSRQVAWFRPSLLDGSWRIVPAIWGTVLVEAALPVLLAVRRTRLVGLAVGTTFSAVLALAGNAPFSALALSVYVVFLPSGAPTYLRTRVVRRPGIVRWAGRARRWGTSPGALVVTVAAWVVGAAVYPSPGPRPSPISAGLRLVLFGMLAAGAVMCIGLARMPSPLRSLRSMRLGHPVFAVGVALVLANGIAPYVGLKTESAFTMFSNLYTEQGYWNHLFIPEAVRVFHGQDEVVRITGSNDPELAGASRDGTTFVRFELDRYLRSHPGTSATYTTAADPDEAMSTDGAPPSQGPLVGTIVKFQPVPPPGRGGCSR